MVCAGYGQARPGAASAPRPSPYGGGASGTNLFVGNLPPHVREQELHDMFSPCGTIVSTKVVIDPATGQSKCAGFVKFSTSDEAQAAISKMNGESGFLVKFADRDAGASKAPSTRASSNLYVSGLPSPELDQAALHEVFEGLGLSVVRSKLIPDTRGLGISAAMVQLASPEQAEMAISQLNGQTLPGRDNVLGVAYAIEKPSIGRLPAVATAPMPLLVKYAGGEQASDNLYLRGLPSPQVDQGLLHELFAGLGLSVVRSRVIPDTKGTGSSAAMVQLASQEEAAAAMEALQGQFVQGLAPPAPAARTGRDMILTVKYAGGDGSTPSDNLYITGLPSPQVDQSTLNQIFAGLGLTVVRSRVIPDTRGSGFSSAMVQLTSQEEAASAILALHGQLFPAMEAMDTCSSWMPAQELGGPTLRVKYAGGDGSQPSDNLYISGLPPAPDQAALHQIFADLGLTVMRSRVIPDTRGAGTGAAMVQLASQEEAASAILALNGEALPPAQFLPSGAAAPALQGPGPGPGPGASTLWVKYAGGDGSQPSDNLYISGLPSPPPSQALLNQVFAGLGLTVVRSKVIPDTRGTGRSSAMVQLSSKEEAAAAIQSLNGEVFPALDSLPEVYQTGSAAAAPQGQGSTTLRVKYAGGDGSQPSDNLYITGLPSPPPDQASLNQIILGMGLTVVRSKVIPDTRGSGFSAAMVQLASQEEAASAIEALNGKPCPAMAPVEGTGGSVLRVKYAGGEGVQASDNLYISGLPSPAPEQAALLSIFAGLGLAVVRSRIIPDTRGFGQSAAMVQLASPEEAATAIGLLNGQVCPTLPCADPSREPVGATSSTASASGAAGASSGSAWRIKYAGDGGPSDNLYISGLPSLLDQAVLNQTFLDLGFTVVRSRVIPDTRGYGTSAAMVQLASQEEAASAIAALSGSDPSNIGSSATSKLGEEVGQMRASEPLTVQYQGDASTPSDCLYISGLPSPQVDETLLHHMFVDQGWTVQWSKIYPDKWGSGSSSAMVQLGSLDEATAAIELWNGQCLPDMSPAGAEVMETSGAAEEWAEAMA